MVKNHYFRLSVIRRLGMKQWLVYFLFQRIFRINANVPWPVHWSSIVSFHDKIEQDGFLPFLGFMPGMYIQAMNGIKIGKNLRTGPGVKIISANHDVNDYAQHVKTRPIVIGDNCWLAANAVILPGVELGDHVVVAAGAVVTKSVPSNCLVAGIPAKIVKNLQEYRGGAQ